jgi:hypothetical protein
MSKVALSTAVKSPNRTVMWSSSTPALICLSLLRFFVSRDVVASFHARPDKIKRDQAAAKMNQPRRTGADHLFCLQSDQAAVN